MFTEYDWIAISFFTFFVIFFKPMFKNISSFFISEEQNIKKYIEDAEGYYKKAKQNLEDTQKIHSELPNSKIAIFEKEDKAIKFDLENRQKDFNHVVEVRKKQLQNLLKREENKFKQRIIKKIIKSFREKLILKMNNSEGISKRFTDIILRNN